MRTGLVGIALAIVGGLAALPASAAPVGTAPAFNPSSQAEQVQYYGYGDGRGYGYGEDRREEWRRRRWMEERMRREEWRRERWREERRRRDFYGY